MDIKIGKNRKTKHGAGLSEEISEISKSSTIRKKSIGVKAWKKVKYRILAFIVDSGRGGGLK